MIIASLLLNGAITTSDSAYSTARRIRFATYEVLIPFASVLSITKKKINEVQEFLAFPWFLVVTPRKAGFTNCSDELCKFFEMIILNIFGDKN